MELGPTRPTRPPPPPPACACKSMQPKTRYPSKAWAVLEAGGRCLLYATFDDACATA